MGEGKSFVGLGLFVALTACDAAGATKLSASDPLHCLVALSAASTLAGQDGDEREKKLFQRRASWFAEKVRLLPESERSDPRVEQISAAFVKPGIDMVGIASDCMKSQDTDPAFRDWLTRK